MKEMFDKMSTEEKNVLCVNHLKTLSRWDLKRILCVTLNVDNYMDDDALRTALEAVIRER